MSDYLTKNQLSPLLEVAKRYKKEQEKSSPFVSKILHYHDKNPEALQQVRLLDEADKLINVQFNAEKKYIAQLGILLILRDLLIDPNQENKIHSYLIEKLDLDNQINSVLKKVADDVEFDLTDPRFLEIGKKAITIGQSIIESPQIKKLFPENFLQNIKEVILAEDDYTDKVLVSLGKVKLTS